MIMNVGSDERCINVPPIPPDPIVPYLFSVSSLDTYQYNHIYQLRTAGQAKDLYLCFYIDNRHQPTEP